MFLIYMVISFAVMFGSVISGSMTPQMAQIWVLTTLSIGSITFALETPKKGK